MEFDAMTVLVLIAILVIGYMMYSSRNVHSHVINPALPTQGSDTATVPIDSQQQQQPEQQPQVVLFYAPWCGHCKTILPVWDQLSQKYSNMVKVNCDENKDVAAKEQVKGFPTVRAYVLNNVVEYQGDRSPADLESFIQNYS